MNRYGSDKDRHGYTHVYHTLFYPLQLQFLNILEIGIGTMIPGVNSSMRNYSLAGYRPGGSLRAWRDYFPQGQIVGMDVQTDTQFEDEKRITTVLCDSTDKEAVSRVMDRLKMRFDIIIDDGSHFEQDQLRTLENLYPYLNKGGYYIIEDIVEHNRISREPHLLEAYCNRDPYFFAGVRNSMCVIYKNPLHSNRIEY